MVDMAGRKIDRFEDWWQIGWSAESNCIVPPEGAQKSWMRGCEALICLGERPKGICDRREIWHLHATCMFVSIV